jgi:Zn-dependent protease with chaperone function
MRNEASPALPPWLAVYVWADVLSGIPSQAALLHSALASYQRPFPHDALLLIALVAGLPNAVLALGVIACLFPRRRARWVERRFRLTADYRQLAERTPGPPLPDYRAVLEEMRIFLDYHRVSSVELRFTDRDGPWARIYPADIRTSRIAVFPRLMLLWRADQAAAEAVLRHELAHQRQGDHLIVGLGSPFVWLVRIMIPASAILVLLPLTIDIAVSGGHAAVVLAGQGLLQLVQALTALVLPITGLWLAELGADRLTSQETGPADLRRALEPELSPDAPHPPVPWVAQALALLSHPPRRLRLRMAEERPASTAVLLFAWPAAMIFQLVLTIITALFGYLLTGEPAHAVASNLRVDTHQLLFLNGQFFLIVAFLLLRWPDLAKRWQRIWSPFYREATPPGPWLLYLAAAVLPAVFTVWAFAWVL